MIIQKVKPAVKPQNVIIEYEKPSAVAIREVTEEGVYRVDPASYQSVKNATGEIKYVERITELPLQSSKVLSQHNLGLVSSSNEFNSHITNMLQNSRSFSSQSNFVQSKFLENSEYETITTSVSETMAKRLISEALAAGMTIQSGKA